MVAEVGHLPFTVEVAMVVQTPHSASPCAEFDDEAAPLNIRRRDCSGAVCAVASASGYRRQHARRRRRAREETSSSGASDEAPAACKLRAHILKYKPAGFGVVPQDIENFRVQVQAAITSVIG